MTGHKSNSFLRPLISLKEFWVLFCLFFTSFLPRKERKERKKVVKQCTLLVRTGKETVAPFLRDGGGEQEKEKQKCKRIKTIASIIFLSIFYILYLDF